MFKIAGRPKPNGRDWLLLGGSVLLLCLVGYFGWWADGRAFLAMTAAEHLNAAKAASRVGRLDEVERHVNAFAKTPEERKQVVDEIRTATELARQQKWSALEAAQAAAESRSAAALYLQSELRDLGYDLRVTQSDKRDELTITSKDFDDTDHRVRFLAFLRGRNDPSAVVCLSGFQAVRLKDAGFLGSNRFSEWYSLECSKYK